MKADEANGPDFHELIMADDNGAFERNIRLKHHAAGVPVTTQSEDDPEVYVRHWPDGEIEKMSEKDFEENNGRQLPSPAEDK